MSARSRGVGARGYDTSPRGWVTFRDTVLDACWDRERFGYVDKDRFVGTCPICAGAIIVRFHGRAARADLECEHRCPEQELAVRLGLEYIAP